MAPRADGVRRPTSADVSKHVSTISHLNRRHSLLAFSATIISRADYFLLPPPLLPPLGNPKKKRKRFQRKFTSPSKCVCVSLSLSLSPPGGIEAQIDGDFGPFRMIVAPPRDFSIPAAEKTMK